ncbi:MAG: hypothetical protein GX587_14500 [Bacteroidales bacterium]|nr:hypothetical protein [Bacteroidales bacterium]
MKQININWQQLTLFISCSFYSKKIIADFNAGFLPFKKHIVVHKVERSGVVNNKIIALSFFLPGHIPSKLIDVLNSRLVFPLNLNPGRRCQFIDIQCCTVISFKINNVEQFYVRFFYYKARITAVT